METLHKKLLEMAEHGIDVMLKPSRFGNFDRKVYSLSITFRYQPSGSSIKTEQTKVLNESQMNNEAFVITEMERMYQELKPHIYTYHGVKIEN